MKQKYYLLILLLISLVACENRHIKHKELDLYFYSELEDNITLEIFKEGEMSTYELTPNDSVFWTTLSWSYDDRFIMSQVPMEFQAYQNYLYLIDSVNVYYNSTIYTYSNTDSIKNLLLHGYDGIVIYFRTVQKKYFGWE